MNEVERWICFDGPEPEHLRALLDELRDVPPPTPEDRERISRRFVARLDERLGRAPAPPSAYPKDLRARMVLSEPPLEMRGIMVSMPSAPPSSGPPHPRDVFFLPVDDERAAAALRSQQSAPFAPCAPPAPPAPVAPVAPVAPPAPIDPPPQPEPPLENLSGTAPLRAKPEDLVQMGKLPFGPPSPEAQRTARTQQMPVYRSGLGDTVPQRDDEIQQAIPALPFAGEPGTSVIRYPNMDCYRYASFCAELAVFPAYVDYIRHRYHVVSKGAHDALDHQWSILLEADPALRALFDRYMTELKGYLERLPR